MKIAPKITAAAVALLVASLAAAPAFAQHRHGHGHGPRISFGLHFGAPIGWYYAPPPVYYHPRRVVVVPAEPTVYVERESAPAVASSPASDNFWYYCGESRAYYPYVRDCAGGWERVPPRPQQ